MIRSRLLISPCIAFLVVGFGVFSQTGIANLATEPCEVPSSDTLESTSSVTADGYYTYQLWRADPASQAAVDELGDSLERAFGTSSKEDPVAQLRNGLLGVAIDDEAHQFVVVTDPGLADQESLEHDLQEAVGPVLDVRVQSGCFGSERLVQAHTVIENRQWHPDARTSTFAFELDPHDSRWHAAFSSGAAPVANGLRQRLGERVDATLSEKPQGRQDRADDGEPHWGGAGIGGLAKGNFCTSGFAVDTGSAGKAMVTAGHCFDNGQNVESGNEPYGTARGKSLFPTFDMLLINGPNQNYDDDLYHNPLHAENDPVDVDGARRADVGDFVCVSGMRTLAVCGREVKGVSAELCDASGCTPDLFRYGSEDTAACQPGDSGAPVYQRPEQDHGAFINGMHIGQVGGANPGCVAEKVGNITSHLSVSVATTP